MIATTDSVPGASEHQQHQADQSQHDSDGPENRDCGQETYQHEDESENDHVRPLPPGDGVETYLPTSFAQHNSRPARSSDLQIDQILTNLCANARDAISRDGHGHIEVATTNVVDPFFTTKDFGEVFGPGLATVHGAVAQNRNSITVSSDVGHCTSFDIHVPSWTDPAVTPACRAAMWNTATRRSS